MVYLGAVAFLHPPSKPDQDRKTQAQINKIDVTRKSGSLKSLLLEDITHDFRTDPCLEALLTYLPGDRN
jgi:hypothetical protein